jgi:hypothetical protein
VLAVVALVVAIVALTEDGRREGVRLDLESSHGSAVVEGQPAYTPRDFLLRSPVVMGGLARMAIRGKVTDSSGAVLPGVDVYARLIPDNGPVASADYLPPPPDAVASTDGEGRYEIELPRRSVAYKVDVGAVSDRHPRQLRQDVVVTEDRVVEVDFVLEDGFAIEGILMDRQGGSIREPIELKATLRRSPVTERMSQFRVDTTSKRLADRDRQHFHESKTLSLSDGTFAFRGLPSGDFQIEVASGPWLVAPVVMAAAGARGVHVRAGQAERLRFHVFDSGRNGRDNGVPFELVATVGGLDDHEAAFSIVTTVPDGSMELAWGVGGPYPEAWKCDYELSIPGLPLIRSSCSISDAAAVPAIEVDVANLERRLFPVSITAWHTDGTEIESAMQLLYASSESTSHAAVELRKVNAFTYAAQLPAGDYFVRVAELSPFAYGTAYRGELKVTEAGGGILDARILRGGAVTVHGMPGPLEAVGVGFGAALSIGSDGFSVFPNMPQGPWSFIQGDRRSSVFVQPNGQHVVHL